MSNTKTEIRTLCIIAFFSLAFSPFFSKASHIRGAELSYKCISANSNFYQVTLKMWRDCDINSANFIDSIYIAIYDTSGNLITGPLGLKMENPYRDTLDNPNCIIESSTICIEEATYQGQYFFGANPEPGGYYITFQQCCRTYSNIHSITNIINSGNVGFSTFIKIPEASLATCNNSIQFDFPKKTFICLDDTLTYDFSATEVDGDSISYEFCSATDGDWIDITGAFNSYLAPSKFIDTFFQ